MLWGRMDVQIHVSLTSAQVGGGQLHAPAFLPSGGKEHPVLIR
jgi:hypothetical protein